MDECVSLTNNSSYLSDFSLQMESPGVLSMLKESKVCLSVDIYFLILSLFSVEHT